jgi:hypothetical protein
LSFLLFFEICGRLLNLGDFCKNKQRKGLYHIPLTEGSARSPLQKLEIADHWKESNGRLILKRSSCGYPRRGLSLKCAASSFLWGDRSDPKDGFITDELLNVLLYAGIKWEFGSLIF